jgi:hypothetical protein
MKIGMIRHAKVLYRDPFFSSGKSFDQFRINYDAGKIAEFSFKLSPGEFPVCYVSSKQRAIDTARVIYTGNFQITDDLIEIPNCAIFLLRLPLPSVLRSMIGRVAWFFNYSKMPETRKESNERARKFIATVLQTTQQDVLLVTHGFFMQSLRHELRKQGFKGKCPYNPRNNTLYIFERGNVVDSIKTIRSGIDAKSRD